MELSVWEALFIDRNPKYNIRVFQFIVFLVKSYILITYGYIKYCVLSHTVSDKKKCGRPEDWSENG